MIHLDRAILWLFRWTRRKPPLMPLPPDAVAALVMYCWYTAPLNFGLTNACADAPMPYTPPPHVSYSLD